VIYPVYTEETSCRDCYKCVRSCPVKAIKVKDGSAQVQKDRCIFCGHCVEICPNNAKKIRSDVDRARMLLKREGKKKFCSLAPSFVSEFMGHEQQLLTALKKIGFDEVSETAIGAAIVTAVIDRYAEGHNGECPWISTACPSVVELVKKYYPAIVDRLSPVPSPLQCHSAYLRHLYGDDITVIFVGPCIAKKHEADITPGFPDLALTFDEIREIFRAENIDLDNLEAEECHFVPSKAGISTFYPVERGMIVASDIWSKHPLCEQAFALSGIGQVASTLKEVTDQIPFLELLACDGGCVNGPVADHTIPLAAKKRAATVYAEKRLDESALFVPEEDFLKTVEEKGYGILNAHAPISERQFVHQYTEEEIRKGLQKLGKETKEDELNCGGCGYSTCREMAIAYLDGMAEEEMCVTKMRKEAQSKVDGLIQTIPMGVVIVDKNLQIADCNLRFLELFGDMDPSILDESLLPMVKGLPLERFVAFHDVFREQFVTEKPGQYRVHFKDKFLRVTFFSVNNKRLIGALFEDVTSPTVKRETVVKRAEDVIQKSLATVQQIASLLGENAAETEIMLNGLIEAFSVHSDDAGDGFSIDKQQDLT
jgi:Iron only hydrogenase large subunit, C-terminal domain